MAEGLKMIVRDPRHHRRDREQRLNDGPVKYLYHQTSAENAKRIVSSQQMLRGHDGLAGGGIYFAESAVETNHKAHKHGVILRVRVRLGRVKRISPEGDGTVNFNRLQFPGDDCSFDSVEIPRPGGTEYVVYNYDQVGHIELVS